MYNFFFLPIFSLENGRKASYTVLDIVCMYIHMYHRKQCCLSSKIDTHIYEYIKTLPARNKIKATGFKIKSKKGFKKKRGLII